MGTILESFATKISDFRTSVSQTVKPEQFVGVQAMSISERKYYERVTREMHAEARALLAARPKRVIREKP